MTLACAPVTCLLGCLVLGTAALVVQAEPPAMVTPPADLGTRDDTLRRLFTPASLPAGTFTVYRSAASIETLAARLRALDRAPAPGAWDVQRAGVFDAFGGEGPYDKGRLARLFSGRSPRLARGSLPSAGGRLSIALISPYPDAALGSLHEGTMVVVTRLPSSARDTRR